MQQYHADTLPFLSQAALPWLPITLPKSARQAQNQPLLQHLNPAENLLLQKEEMQKRDHLWT